MQINRDEYKKKRRENRTKKRINESIEKKLDSKNAFGINDPTPKAAINNIINSKAGGES